MSSHVKTLEGLLVERGARNRLAESIRHLAAGVITNVEVEDRVLSRSADPAIGAVFVFCHLCLPQWHITLCCGSRDRPRSQSLDARLARAGNSRGLGCHA